MLRSIEAERVRKGWTKEELAKKLNVSTKTYYNWINEETDVPSSALLRMSKNVWNRCGLFINRRIWCIR